MKRMTTGDCSSGRDGKRLEYVVRKIEVAPASPVTATRAAVDGDGQVWFIDSSDVDYSYRPLTVRALKQFSLV